MSLRYKRQSGFTLPELLVVCVLVIGLLALALKVAHPQNFSARKNNAVRWLAVAQQIQLLNQYVAAEGALPEAITEERMIVGSEEGMANLCPLLVPKYAEKLIFDPAFGREGDDGGCEETGSFYTTGIAVVKTKDNKVTVSAPGAEHGEKISLTKEF